MKELAAGPRVEEFFSRLARARARLLLLDYDGTLAPFRTNRERAEPYPGVRERLAAIQESGATRLVILSGRIAREVPPLLGLDPAPEVWGVHGGERLRSDGTLAVRPLAPLAAQALSEATLWLAAQGWETWTESKSAGVAVHWRGLPQAQGQDMARRLRTEWEGRAAACGLEILPFDGGLELRSADAGKGAVVAELAAEMAPGTAIAFLGDDVTDERGFAALPADGLGVLVATEPRPSRARLWIRPPEELLDFLDRWRTAWGDE